ncbi:MAG: hypothetical protein J0H88_03355 [Sphingomonadales bacterium]|nr:hypothetical protein [Sphingomonadales bacterium]
MDFAPSGGVAALDAGFALATEVQPPAAPSSTAWDGQYRFDLPGGETLILPDDGDALFDAILGIYLVSGMDGVMLAHEAVAAAVAAFTADSEARRNAEQRMGGAYGVDDGPLRDFEAAEAHILRSNPGLASHPDLATAQDRALRFRQRMVAAIDDILVAEEEAQRWYEDRLMAAIDADLRMQKGRIADLWSAYDIRTTKGDAPVPIDKARSAEGLTIASRKDAVQVEVVRPGGKTREEVHPILPMLHEAGVFYYDYVQAVRIKRERGGAAGSGPGAVPREKLRDLLKTKGREHFAIFTCYRKVVGDKATDTQFDPARVQTILIQALIDAHQAIDPMIANLARGRLFATDTRLAVTGGPEPGTRAATRAIADRYSDRRHAAKGGMQGDKPPEILASPWLQSPFHERIKSLAATVADDQGQAPGGNLGDAPTAHLAPVFAGAEDRQLLLAVATPGTLTWRARQEMLLALAETEKAKAEMREKIALAVSAIGLIGVPFTGGGSALLAGIIDAMIVAERTSEEVANWIDARAFNKLVIDEISDAVWTEPAVAELVLLVIEAGFEIAADLVTDGMASRVFDAVMVLEIFGALGTAALEAGGRP